MDRKTLKLIIAIAAVVAVLLGIALLVVGILYDESVLTKVVVIIVAALSLVLGGELGYFLLLMNDVRPNYFLYDTRLKRNMSVQRLTFEDVAVRMNRYFSGFASSEGKIWTDRILDAPDLDMSDAFKPVVAYKLLYDLAEKDVDAGWACFDLASDTTVGFVCSAIESNGDADMAKMLRRIKAQKPLDTAFLRDFLIKNRKYLKSRMFRYVYENIDLF